MGKRKSLEQQNIQTPSSGNWDHPKPASGLDIAFGPQRISDFLPSKEEIPDEFWRYPGTSWNRIASQWFFTGVKLDYFIPKDGIDLDQALRHLGAILGSFEPKHEHKEAGVAYLMSLWFKGYKGSIK